MADSGNGGADELSDELLAVSIRSASKGFGFAKRRSNILRSLDMAVKKGTIYGLLGASGCGKTTLLSCIVGRCSLDSGEVLVFGTEPQTGPRVGYMPQELALYGEFTIKETFIYFARLYNLPTAFVKAQIEFLFKLLHLPPKDRSIKTLSGGQQRRVSFAVALFHDPQLLILDEPTVGLDPVLSQSIWNHLIKLSTTRQRTVIITTHYIEEARQSNTIGMMRSGVLIAQDSPHNLLTAHNLDSLEDVFLQLCVKQNSAATNDTAAITGEDDDNDRSTNKTASTGRNRRLTPGSKLCNKLALPSYHRTSALIYKNLVQNFRNIGILIFTFLLPVMVVSMFCLAIGGDPTGLKLAIVNEELSGDCHSSSYEAANHCDYSMISCRYLLSLTNETITQVAFSNLSEAMNAAKSGQTLGVVHFGRNFSQEFQLRVNKSADVDITSVLGSQINIHLDWSNQQIAFILQRRLLEAYQDFGKAFAKSCSQEEMAASIPVTFMDPVYGVKNPSFTNSMIPGLILFVVYIMAVGGTALSLVVERKHGLLDRVFVAGVEWSEIVLAQLIHQFFIMVGQAVLIFIFVLFVFNNPIIGSLTLAICLSISQGFCGMCLGLLVSSLCDEESSTIQMSLGLFYPSVLLCGIIWPLEGIQPLILRQMIYFLPQTYAVEAMGSIFTRGWGMERPPVYLAFITTITWVLTFLIMCLVVLRIRKYTG